MNFTAIMQVAKLVPLIIGAVQSIEQVARGTKGKAKQDAAVGLVRTLLPAIEDFVGKDLLNDPKVEQAIRGVMDAIVALQNVVIAVRGLRDVSDARPTEAIKG